MSTYAIAVICAIAVSSVFIFLIFNRMKLLNFRILLSVTIASLISAITLPGVFNAISANNNGDSEFKTLLAIMIISVAVYILLSFIMSVIISHVIPGKIGKKETSDSNRIEAVPAESDPKWMSAIVAAESAEKAESSVPEEIGTAEVEEAGTMEIPPAAETEMKPADTLNYLEQIYDNMMHDKGAEAANNVEYVHKDENNLEKSVDSIENIDKMGIENKVQESENLTISECIEEAFRLKEQADGEGAILYYMYALDKQPEKELAFWIVLDICVLYKTLGQSELAYDILNSYNDAFGDIMDDSVRKEIEYNLSGV
ncbi:MAG: hypothetical protein ABFD25_15405 [Clostridiaceae bacterium]